MLFHGMLHVMLWEGWVRQDYLEAHTTGFDDLKATVRECTPDLVAQVCGISKEDLFTAAKLFATSGATLSLYCQGLNQSSSGSAKNAALINLHLATAQIGKPGAGPFSLTGQPNAMGGREVGGMANLLSAHRDLANPQHRAEVAALWGVPSVPEKPGKTAVEMFQAAADGEIKALWIACTNPAQSMPDQATVRRALQRAEFVVVQEAFSTTATCDYADILLPATTWGEKTGTVTNSERRISRVRPAIPKPAGTRHDWSIAVEFAHRLERKLRPGLPTLFPYSLADETAGAEQIWNEHRESTRGRDLDITGMSYALLDQAPLQWPMAAGEAQGKPRLYEDGIFPTPDGKARFANVAYQPLAEPREARYPFSLTTGRLRDQWHGMSRTGTLGRLFGHVAEPAIQMHAQDMARRLLKDGDLVHVTSKRGSIVVPVQASEQVGMGQAFMAMHWGPEFLGGCSSTGSPLAGVNALTTSAYCPTSKQPELKHAAVKILKAELPWSLLAVAWLPDGEALHAREELKQVMALFPFASCVPFGRERSGRAAARRRARSATRRVAGPHRSPDGPRGPRHAALCGSQEGPAPRHAPRAPRRGSAAGEFRAGRRHQCPGLDQDAAAGRVARAGLRPPAAGARRKAAGGGAVARQAGLHLLQRDGYATSRITWRAARAPEATRLDSLQGELRCGTNCGSCVPELKRLVRSLHSAAATRPSA